MERLSGLGMKSVRKRRKEITREVQNLEFPIASGGALKKSGLDVCEKHDSRQLDLSEFSHMQQHARGQKPLTRVCKVQGVKRMGSNGAVQRSCSTPSGALNRAREASEVKGGPRQVQTPTPCHPGVSPRSHCRSSWRTPQTPRSPPARKSQTLVPTQLIWLRHVMADLKKSYSPYKTWNQTIVRDSSGMFGGRFTMFVRYLCMQLLLPIVLALLPIVICVLTWPLYPGITGITGRCGS